MTRTDHGSPTGSPTSFIDALRLSVGTLTAFKVRAPGSVEPPVPGRAMALAPLAGAVPGLLGWALAFVALRLALSPLVAAVLIVAAYALATRALHLDGLADTADGFTASYDRDRALDVMRRGDSGPAGVVMVVIVIVLQVAALVQVLGLAHARFPPGVVADLRTSLVAVTVAVTARVAIPVICRCGIPPARPQGLGAMVAGSVGLPLLTGSVLTAAVVAGLTGRAAGLHWWAGPLGVLVTVVAGELLTRRAIRRLGGITGDIIGAGVEIGAAVALLALAASCHPL